MRRVSRYRVPARTGPGVSFSTRTPAGSHSMARSRSFVRAKTRSRGARIVSVTRNSTGSLFRPDVLGREDDVVEPDAVLLPELDALAARDPIGHVVRKADPVDRQLLRGAPADP